VVRAPVVRKARGVNRDPRGAWFRPNARYAGVVLCGVWFRPNARYAGCDSVPMWSADAGGSSSDGDRDAEPAAVADAAARPRDRAVFEGWR